MNPHFVTWEALYSNGVVVRERDGFKYDWLDRTLIEQFAFYSSEHAERVFAMPVEAPERFFYRRRTQMMQGGRSRIVYLVGFYPDFGLEFDPAAECINQIEPDIDPLPFENFR